MSKNLKDYLPKEIKVGPYTYSIVIENLVRQEVHGLCDFIERKISLSSELNYDLTKPNALYTLEVFLHEVLHAFNYNSGLRSMNWKGVSAGEIEEEFVDHSARHIIQLISDNTNVITLFQLFDS